jgi:hypothetical protein
MIEGEVQVVDQRLQVAPIPGFERKVSLAVHARSHLTAKLLSGIVKVALYSFQSNEPDAAIAGTPGLHGCRD